MSPTWRKHGSILCCVVLSFQGKNWWVKVWILHQWFSKITQLFPTQNCASWEMDELLKEPTWTASSLLVPSQNPLIPWKIFENSEAEVNVFWKVKKPWNWRSFHSENFQKSKTDQRIGLHSFKLQTCVWHVCTRVFFFRFCQVGGLAIVHRKNEPTFARSEGKVEFFWNPG
jgi:hypothetical protein